MQRGVIALVLQAPEVLHAQTLGGNMLSRDNVIQWEKASGHVVSLGPMYLASAELVLLSHGI